MISYRIGMNKDKRNKIVAVLLMALIAFVSVGCGGGGETPAEEPPAEEPVDTAPAEEAPPVEQPAEQAAVTGGEAESGEVTVYTALEDEQVTAYLEAFNAKYPDITINPVRESTGIITARLLAEKDNPQADVVWGTAASSLMVLDTNGMLEGYAPEGVDRILPQFKSDQNPPTWEGIDAWETAIIVNTVEFEKTGAKPIKSYEDLLQPELKDSIVMSNPNSSGTGFLTVNAILQLKGKDTEEGWTFLDKLNDNVSQYVHSGSKPAKMAGAGETPVGISFGYAGISQLKDGAPVEIIFPEEGSGWDLEANALMKKPEIKEASKTFLNWAISEEAMALYKENYPILATGEGGKYEGFDADPVEQLIENDFVWISENRDDILAKWLEKYDSKSEPEA
jgi:iron(III) transport system substrate-binding protein